MTTLAFVFTSITFKINGLMEQQNEMVSNLSQVEYLSSSTQRLAKMIITNDKNNKVIFYIHQKTMKNLDSTNSDSLPLLANHDNIL